MNIFYGTINQTSPSLPDSEYVGLQCTAISYTALIYEFGGRLATQASIIDEIVLAGHCLYVDCLKTRMSGPRMLGHFELPTSFVTSDGSHVTSEIFLDQFHGFFGHCQPNQIADFQLSQFSEALRRSLEMSNSILITVRCWTVAAIRQISRFLLFDSHGHNNLPAAILTFCQLSDLENHMMAKYAIQGNQFEISPVRFSNMTASVITPNASNHDVAYNNDNYQKRLIAHSENCTNLHQTLISGQPSDKRCKMTGQLSNAQLKTAPATTVTDFVSVFVEQLHSETTRHKSDRTEWDPATNIKIDDIVTTVCNNAKCLMQDKNDEKRQDFASRADEVIRTVCSMASSASIPQEIQQAQSKEKMCHYDKVSATINAVANMISDTSNCGKPEHDKTLFICSPNPEIYSESDHAQTVYTNEDYGSSAAADDISITCDSMYNSGYGLTQDIVDTLHKEHLNQDFVSFRKLTEALPDHHCFVCHKMLFYDQVFHCNSENFENCFDLVFSCDSDLCHTCCRKLKQRQIPQKCWKNNLNFPSVPMQLSHLNVIEKRFIAQLQTYFTLLVLPGGQYAENGLAIHFPFNVIEYVSQLPCTEESANVICVAGNVRRVINIPKIKTALHWLQKHNHLYKDVVMGEPLSPDDDANNLSASTSKLDNIEECGSIPIDQVITFPPSSSRPVSYEDEPCSEALAFPWLHPYGTSQYNYYRELHITLLSYYQSRFLCKDNLFRLDISYLIVAVNHFERTFLRSIVGIYTRIYKQFDEGTSPSYSIPTALTAKDVRGIQFKNELMYGSNSYMFTKQIRGTVAYWRNELWNLMARVRLLGPPNLFVTLSAADTQWIDLKNVLSHDSQTSLSSCNLSNLIRKNPVMTAIYFERRFRAFFRHILNGKTNPLGNITDHWARVEFQNRGSPHIHMFLWIKSAPTFENRCTETEMTNFIDRVISTELPNDPELNKLVSSVQIHRHTHTCRKYSTMKCRFNYPRSECKKTRIIPERLSSHGRVFYETKRTAASEYVNAYNPYLLSIWRANMDIQMINGISGLAAYVCNYICKAEPDDLKDALAKLFEESEEKSSTAKQKLFKIGMCILKHRQMSAQEAAYRICHLPLVYSSRQCVSINTFLPSKRMKLLKPKAEIQQIPDNSEDIFLDSVIDKYRMRPVKFEKLSLYQFASDYRLKKSPDAMILQKRNKSVAIRTPHFLPNTDEYFYSILLLYYPHRNEGDLVGTFESPKQALEANLKALSIGSLDREKRVTELFECTSKIQCLRKYDEEIVKLKQLLKTVPPEQHVSANDGYADIIDETACNFSHEEEVHLDQCFSLDELHNESNAFSRLTSDTECTLNNITSLNSDQLFVLDYVKAKKNRQESIKIFLTGEAGTGKSYLLKLLIAWLRNSQFVGTGKETVLVTAPTGIAALNIDGVTLHSAFCLPVQHGKEPSSISELSQLSLKRLRTKLIHTKCLVIDEISMVSSKMLDFVNSRLCSITQSNAPFGNLDVILCGDFFQLKPVRGKFAFTNALLWPLFQPIFLTENVRQCKDVLYAQLLSRARVGMLSPADVGTLQSRINVLELNKINSNDLHLFPTCNQVAGFNERKQNQISVPIYTLQAIDIFSSSDFAAGCRVPETFVPIDSRNAGGFATKLKLSVGTRVMLLRNLCCEDGLVNGVLGYVTSFEKTSDLIDAVFIRFDDNRVGRFFKDKASDSVCINRHSVDYVFKGRFITRIQFPLAPSWGCTIHKAQGISLPSAIVNVGKQIFAPGQAYVALSRVQTLSGLTIDELCVQRCYANPEVLTNEIEMLKLFQNIRH